MQIDSNPLTTLAKLKTWLGITTVADDAVLQWSIEAASRAVQTYCGRNFTETRYYEIRDGGESRRMALAHYPVSIVRFVGIGWDSVLTVSSTISTDVVATVAVNSDHLHLYRMASNGQETSETVPFGSHQTSGEIRTHINTLTGFSASLILDVPAVYIRKLAGRSLKNGPAYLEAPTDSLEDYQVDLDSGIIYGQQLPIHRSVLVDYTAGYATIPYDVENATISVAARLFRDRTRDPGVTSESLGGYSYSRRGSSEIDATEAKMLAPYRRLR